MRLTAPTAPISAPGKGQEQTPAIRQYLKAKSEHPDCLVLFRLGDFFEIFGDDAILAAPILGVTLTGRDFGRQGRMPMCGVPHHSVEGYVRRLLDAGLKVALCDQVEESRGGGRLVAREVVRVLSAGTIVEDTLLDSGRARRCAAVQPSPGAIGVAAIDFSTGECVLTTSSARTLRADLDSLDVAEVVHPEDWSPELGGGLAVTSRPAADFSPEAGAGLLSGRAEPPEALAGGEAARACLGALGAVARYGGAGLLTVSGAFLRPHWRLPQDTMALDHHTISNLEVVQPLGSGGWSLLQILDRTRCAPGARRLRSWLLAPLTDLDQLRARQEAVSDLMEKPDQRGQLLDLLGECRDLERLLARCVHGLAGPRDVAHLAQTLLVVPRCAAALHRSSGLVLNLIRSALESAPVELGERILDQLAPEVPVTTREGGFIRAGADLELDHILAESAEARAYISGLEEVERRRTGLRNLKVGYNRVFGYYIEVRGAARDDLPDDYLRRQTLTGAERYVTADLKDREVVVLSARDRALKRELEILRGLVADVAAEAAPLAAAAGALADLDALCSLAEVGAGRGWVMPSVDGSLGLWLEQARHPLVEEALGPGRFVPNDSRLDGDVERIWLITGPNMAGKSTFLRQVAVNCLLAQVGSPVPCTRATLGLVDRIFTRVGAHDDLSGGRSTFMVEMTEVAEILDAAGPRSLLILDEVGRGTSTYDGMSIAQAILEHLHNREAAPARVFFSTHYHELTALDRLPALRNYRAEVVEEGNGPTAEVTFLHTVVPGGADRSYGIHVARLAGLPEPVLARAEEILESLERSRPIADTSGPGLQMSLPLAADHPVVQELRSLEVERMTPLQALQKISEWQQRSAE